MSAEVDDNRLVIQVYLAVHRDYCIDDDDARDLPRDLS